MSRIPKAIAIVVVLVVTCSATSAQLVNPANSHTYILTPTYMQLTEARNYAAGLCGYLLAINDAAEQAWVAANFTSEYEYWLGASDEAAEGVWLWDSGEPFTYTAWCLGEPNNFFLENYADYKPDCGAGSAGWNDVWPFNQLLGIIEIPVLVPGPGLGQANSAAASLTVNGNGCVTSGLEIVYLDQLSVPVMELYWRGPANMPYTLIAGPPNPYNLFVGCVGWVEIGTPLAYSDIVFLFNGIASPLFTLDGEGTARQTFTVPPGLPSGLLLTIQGIVWQATGCTPLVLTKGFALSIT